MNGMRTHLSKYAAEGKSSPRHQPARILSLFALSLVALAFQSTSSYAQNSIAPPSVTLGNLSGVWVVSLTGVTGCGQVAMRVLADLNSSGTTSDASLITHSSECGNGTATEAFEITSLQSSGTGNAHLSCGEGCGWDFDIQVEPGNNAFTLVDVTNGQNYLEGTAVRKQ